MGVSLVIVLIPLGFVLFTVIQKGWQAVTASGCFTEDIPPARQHGSRHGAGGRRHDPHHRAGHV